MTNRQMTFDQARRIVEGKLASYSFVIGNYPDVPVHVLYQRMQRTVDLGTEVQSGGHSHNSPQEDWATRHAQQIEDASRIERVMKQLPRDERHLIFMRYMEKNNWGYIANQLHMSRPTAYRVRDRALMAFAIEFGLIATRVVESG